MCKYCASISSEFEYVNLIDSLSAVTESDNISRNSDLDRIEIIKNCTNKTHFSVIFKTL